MKYLENDTVRAGAGVKQYNDNLKMRGLVKEGGQDDDKNHDEPR